MVLDIHESLIIYDKPQKWPNMTNEKIGPNLGRSNSWQKFSTVSTQNPRIFPFETTVSYTVIP